MAKAKPQAGTNADFITQAQSKIVSDLAAQIPQLEAQLKPLQIEAAKIRLGGHDIHAKGASVDYLAKIMRDFPTPETTAKYKAFVAENIAPIQTKLAHIKQQHSTELDRLTALQQKHIAEHAPALLEQAIQACTAALAAERACREKLAGLQQRRTAAVQLVAQHAAVQLAHDQAVAEALARGDDAPPAPALEAPAETPEQLAAAIKMVAAELEQLVGNTRNAESKMQHFKNVIARKALDQFMADLVNQAANAGVPLKDVRDGLIQQIGRDWTALADASDRHRLQAEVATLRPECESLRARVQLLEKAVQSAAQHGGQQGRSAQASFSH